MATIFDLSLRQRLRLQSLEPILDKDYEAVLMEIFEVLDGTSKNILLRHNLNPKSIFYDSGSKTLHYSPPLSFHSTIHNKKILNDTVLETLHKMERFLVGIQPPKADDDPLPALDTYEFCQELEELLDAFTKQKSTLGDNEYNDILIAFLYEFIQYLEHLELTVPQNRRGLTGNVMKIFLKEVYIKHTLQGINFNAWDDDDIEALSIDYMPDPLKHEIQNRKLAVIETAQFWFLISPVTDGKSNRYSACRFLHEDNDFGLYLTHGLCIPKNIYKNEKALAIIMELFTSIYTLEMSVSMEVVRFSEDCKKAQHEHLTPLLTTPLPDDILPKDAIRIRLNEYERKLTDLILCKIPNVIQNAHSKDDYFIFNHYLEKTLNELWWDLECFNLLPSANASNEARLLCNRLLSYRLLLKKAQPILWNANKDWKTRIETLLKPKKSIQHIATEAVRQDDDIDTLINDVKTYEENLEEGRLFARLGFGRPDYTIEELRDARLELIEDTFIKIVECANLHKDTTVCFELENPSSYINDDEHSHYAICHSRYAIDKLPFIICLPKNKIRFKIQGFYEQVQALCESTH